ncbi:MAG: FCD domain-containing protein [Gammaproteobacteria bacterium]|nr:FCD domain-containing protein [Gammaproteobacteria bacterium]
MPSTVTTASSIARRIETLILDGTLPPGKKIPSERQLAERMGVSRPILREAIKELRGRGVVNTEHGRGTFVMGMVQESAPTSPLVHLYKDHSRTVYDLLEVRELLEGQAAKLAAIRATQADKHNLTKAFEALDAATAQTETYEAAKLDHNFHHAIYIASHNPVLVHTLENLMELMRHSVFTCVSNLYHRPAQKAQIDRQHRQIYQAIMGGQDEWAQKSAANHIRHVANELREIEREEERLVRAENWEKISTF